MHFWGELKTTCFAILTEGYNQQEMVHVKKGEFLNVDVVLNIKDFLMVDEVGQTLKVVLAVNRMWFDSQLTFLHIKSDPKLNVLWERSYDKIWYPKIIFENIDPSEDYNERRLVYKILRNMSVTPTIRNPGTFDSANVFKGSDHRIVRSKEYTYYWKCVYDLKWYPFDTQTCSMLFSMPQHQRNFVRLKPQKIKYQSNGAELTEYSVDKLILCSKSNGTQLVLEVTLGRPLMGSILTIYIPTLLLLVIR